MRNLPSFPIQPVAGVVFLAALVIGWNQASPPRPASVVQNSPAESGAKRVRSTRIISPAVATAGKRMAAIRAAADPEARLLATLSLANSLSPEDFAAWKDGGLFDLRGGPELMIFSKILMDRWQAEDPDGLLAWAEKNQNGGATGVMLEWAAKDPQRLFNYFKTHRDDSKELNCLKYVAGHSPDLALQRLKEMTAAGLSSDAWQSASGLMAELAEKSPAGLAAILDALPGEMRLGAEGALSSVRLKSSFSEEIHRLGERPDGLKIFSHHVALTDEMGAKLIKELPNLPAEWLRGIALNPGLIVGGSLAQTWWDADLQAAGFSLGETQSIRGLALQKIASNDPEKAIRGLAEEDLAPNRRRSVLVSVFQNGDLEKVRPLLDQLTDEEDRKTASRILDLRSAPVTEIAKVNTPAELWAKADSPQAMLSYLSQARGWDEGKIAELAAGFNTLPEGRKELAAQAIVDGNFGALTALQSVAMRYLLANPGSADGGSKPRSDILSVRGANYAVSLSVQDPTAASAWVESLPAGENKAWVQKNLIRNWHQYDPKAAAAWEKGLPAADRAAIQKLSVPTP